MSEQKVTNYSVPFIVEPTCTTVLTVANKKKTIGKVLAVQRRPDILERGLFYCALSPFLLTKDVLIGR